MFAGERDSTAHRIADGRFVKAALGGDPLEVHREQRRKMRGIVNVLEVFEALSDDETHETQQAQLIWRRHD